jgi:hypothetical protein
MIKDGSCQTTLEALWKGREITYLPGKIGLKIKKGHNNKAYCLISKFGGTVHYTNTSGDVLISVPPQDTLKIALELSISGFFYHVNPCDSLDLETYK